MARKPASPGRPARGTAAARDAAPWSSLRLRDRIAPGVRVLFVGINPGVRSALTGHHFAGFSNRFWRLLAESKLVPEPITYVDDGRLPEWGLGITNLIARPSPGIDDLRPAEYVEGWKILEKKIARYAPEVVALVGVTVYRLILPLLDDAGVGHPARGRSGSGGRHRAATPAAADDATRTAAGRARNPATSVLGLRPQTIQGARVFVLPNPSGRNANYGYADMLEAFRALRQYLE